MRNRLILYFAYLMAIAVARTQAANDNLVFVEGGIILNTKSNYHGRTLLANSPLGRPVEVAGFFIGKYEVTQQEWADVMGSNPSKFQADNLPVETVSWYDCVEYCNRRSIKEGLRPYYTIDRNTKDPNNRTEIDDVKWTVSIDPGADGYRLPTEVEWEYAAGGGRLSRSYTFSGSDDLNRVAWFWQNAGDKPLTGQWYWPTIEKNNTRAKPVGGKQPNELGLYDMSGNVREWCWDWFGELESNGSAAQGSSSESGRVWKGGGWIGGDFCCAIAFRAGLEANGKGPDQGLRVCRSK